MASCGPSRRFNLGAVLETHAKHLNASRFSESDVLCLQPLYWRVSSVLITLKPGGDYMIDHLSKNEARDKTAAYGEEGNVEGFSSAVDAFHSFASCAK